MMYTVYYIKLLYDIVYINVYIYIFEEYYHAADDNSPYRSIAKVADWLS